MRSAIGWREVCAGAIFLAALAGSPGKALATPQVVGDEACERYAIDIASFATCEGHRVVKPEPTGHSRAATTASMPVVAPSGATSRTVAPDARKRSQKATATTKARRS